MSQDRYDKEELKKLLSDEKNTYAKIARMYGVSVSSIKKAAKKFHIDLPKVRPVLTSLVYVPSDDEFSSIIQTSNTWKEIGVKLGYKTKNLSSNVKQTILQRCESLNISVKLSKMFDLLSVKKGDLFRYRKNWQSARSAIAKLAKIVYFENKEAKCELCGYDKHIEVAHIKSVSSFGDDATIREIDNINNLIGLCPNHHWEYDHGLLNLDDYRSGVEK